jgi:predicted transcriptional regulator
MLFKRAILHRLIDGSATLAFRRWRKPTVRAGGRLTTELGVLAIDAVEQVDDDALTEESARQAGFESLAELQSLLRPDGDLYRVRLHYAGPDPRLTLRDSAELDEADLQGVVERLEAMDRHRAWVRSTLDLIERHPGRPASELAAELGRETPQFKANVRRLKALGLTESLEVGYRLSPRGKVVLAALQQRP